MKLGAVVLCFYTLVWSAAYADNDGSGLKVGANADIIGQMGLDNRTQSLNRFQVREVEIIAYSPIDHLFNGRVSVAVHAPEAGEEAFAEMHEAYVETSKLIPRSRVKLGQYFLGVGRLNQFHRHDWPFISAPRVQQEFLLNGGPGEGYIDTGIEYGWLTPLPFYLDITIGLTAGWVFGHGHGLGDPAMVPTHYVRASTFQEFGQGGGLLVGFNYMGNRSNNGTGITLLGLDATAKWREEKVVKFLLQGEAWYRRKGPESGDPEKAFGAYLFPNYYVGSDLYVGVLADVYHVFNQDDGSGGNLQNFDYSFVPTLTWKPSEFSTFRLAFNARDTQQAGQSISQTKMIEAQAVFVLGAHPTHEF